MARIAIYGSCVTRDAFEVRPHDHEIVAYLARSSIISQNAPPVPYTWDQLGIALRPWSKAVVTADLEKTVVKQIGSADPDLVIVDLIDERLPLLRHENLTMTLSPYAADTPLARRMPAAARRIDALSRARDREFRAAAGAVMGDLAEAVGSDRILVHRALFATRSNGKRFGTREQIGSLRMNRRLKRWSDAVAQGARCRQFAPAKKTRVADATHKWGLSPYHYVDEYYAELMDEVDRIVRR